MNRQRLGNDLLDTKSRVERSKWILKDNLQVAPQTPHFTVTCRQQVAPLVLYDS